MKPLEDRVILKPIKVEEEKRNSGLVLIAFAEEKNNEAIVVEVGEGRVLPNGNRVPMDVAIGDKVLFNPLATQSFEYEGENYLVIFTKDILAILEGNDE
jgi:chaperonin GroES